jgi:hypothetical protein
MALLRFEALDGSDQARYKMRVSFGELTIERRDYPIRMSRIRAEKEAIRLAERALLPARDE